MRQNLRNALKKQNESEFPQIHTQTHAQTHRDTRTYAHTQWNEIRDVASAIHASVAEACSSGAVTVNADNDGTPHAPHRSPPR